MSRQQASELAGRLNWASYALFGRCGRAFVAPNLRRATAHDPWWTLNVRLRRALCWWERWLLGPEDCLVCFVPALPRLRARPALSYSDASTDFGLGGIQLLPDESKAWWFSTRVPPGECIGLL